MSSSKQIKPDKNKNIQTLKRILQYIKGYRPAVLLSLSLAVATVALTLYIPILTGRAVDQIIGAGQVDFPACLASSAPSWLRWP